MEKNIRREEIETNKLLLVFVLVFIGIFGTMYLAEMSDWPHTFMLAYTIINVLSVGSLVLAIISFVKHVLNVKKRATYINEYINAKNIFCVSTVILICAGFIQYFTIFNATKYIYAFLPAVAILYFILVTYSRDTFIISFANIFTIVCTYYLSTLFYRNLFFIVALGNFLFLFALLLIILTSNKMKDNYIKRFLQSTNKKLLSINVVILMILLALSVVLAFLGLHIGYMMCIVYFVVCIFYNTLKIL